MRQRKDPIVSIPENPRIPRMSPPARPKLERVSPGIYRGADGNLVRSSGPSQPGQGRASSIADAWSRNGRSLEDMAQERANAIRNGGVVTMDINIPRDRRVNEILGRPQPDYLKPQDSDMQATIEELLRRFSK